MLWDVTTKRAETSKMQKDEVGGLNLCLIIQNKKNLSYSPVHV